MLTGPAPARPRPISVIGIGAAGEQAALKVSQELRQSGLTVELNYRGGLKRGLRRADKIGAAAAVFLGDDELARDGATVRNLDDGLQTEVSLADLKDHLAEYR
jgi:histidyl-tRNA synthetase